MRSRGQGGRGPTRPGIACCLALGAVTLLVVVPHESWAKDPGHTISLVSCAAFTSYRDLGLLLAEHAEAHPDIARAFSIGTSVEGRDIHALLVSSDPDIEADEPELRIVGAIHGNECMAVEAVLAAIEWLLSAYGTDPVATAVVEGAEVLFVPLVNPDGYSSYWATRSNARGIDLNRNMGIAWVAYGEWGEVGENPFSEPETRALRDASQANSFVLGLSYHTAARYVNGPWNYTPHHPPDDALVDAIGGAYAGSSEYEAVFGWDWFAIQGDLNDWSLGARGTFDWTIELRSDWELDWEVHEAGLQGFLPFAFVGVRGLVRDAATGAPLAARIEVEPYGAPVFTDPRVGDYHRVLLPGTYTVTARAQGYEPASRAGAAVGSGEATRVDLALALAPSGTPEHGFAVVETTMPEPIDERYVEVEYENRTLAWDALGPPDGRPYSMSPSGSITLDMGEGRGVTDALGADLEIVSSTGSDDQAVVLVALSQDGPFVETGQGTATFEVDIDGSGLALARYVRVVDQGEGPFNDAAAGFDLDAVTNLSPLPHPDPADGDADVDVDSDADVDSDQDRDREGEAQVDADVERDGGEGDSPGDSVDTNAGSGCGCAAPGRRGARAARMVCAAIGLAHLGANGGDEPYCSIAPMPMSPRTASRTKPARPSTSALRR